MFDILNEMCELVYIVNLETFELLYLNNAGKEIFGLDADENVVGRKCYSLLQGLSEPCSFCPNARLSENAVYCWEQTNPVVGRHYMLKDKLLTYDGIAAKVEIAFDTTDLEQKKYALEHQLAAEELILLCIRQLHLFHDPHEDLPYILEEIGSFLQAEQTYILEVHDQKLYTTFEWCAQDSILPERQLSDFDEAFFADSLKSYFTTEESCILEDTATLCASHPETYQLLDALGIHTLAVVPIELDGTLAGCIGVNNPARENLADIPLIFHTLRYFFMAAIRRELDEKRLLKLNSYDSLTGAYNRNRYIKDTKQLEGRGPVGIVYLDINGLKEINDQLGHSSGDQVILNTVGLIREVFGDERLYRVGGDEFIILCQNCGQEHFHELIFTLKKKFEASRFLSAAIGYQWSETGQNVEQDVSLADIMMYEDKKAYYRGVHSAKRYRHYNDDILGLSTPAVLRQEVANGHFLVYLQPKISFDERQLVGAEALVRYLSPEGEIVPPFQILPQLEEVHLISEIDFFVFERVCQILASWTERGIPLIAVSVNFSRDTISETNFLARLESLCQQYDTDKRYLEIEITESLESLSGFDLKGFTTKMHNAGFLISIDDFGVHYANLSLLTSIQFDKLKLDKSLIDTLLTNLKTQAVVKALSFMCYSLNIHTTVEGVESEKQFALLRDMGFQEAQGFLFNPPLPIAEFEKQYH